MAWNEKGSKMEHTCTWVLCADYLRERERERERERDAKEYQSITNIKRKKREVRMHEKCMNMWHATK